MPCTSGTDSSEYNEEIYCAEYEVIQFIYGAIYLVTTASQRTSPEYYLQSNKRTNYEYGKHFSVSRFFIAFVFPLKLGTLQYSTAQHSTVQYSTAQHSTAQHSTAQHSTVQYSTVQYSTVQYSTVQYSTVQYSTEQFSTVQYSTVQYSTVQYSTVEQNSRITLLMLTSGSPTYDSRFTKIFSSLCEAIQFYIVSMSVKTT